MTALISPSILNCDFSHLADELDKIASADFAHIDIMDNHFVPNLALGLPIAEAAVREGEFFGATERVRARRPEDWYSIYCHVLNLLIRLFYVLVDDIHCEVPE